MNGLAALRRDRVHFVVAELLEMAIIHCFSFWIA